MNKVYKLKLLRDTRQLVVVSELATNAVSRTATAAAEAREFLSADSLLAQPQDSTKTKLSATAGSLLVAALGLAAPLASATTDPQVVAGTAEITKQGLVTTIKNTPNTIINWNSFSIAKNEIVEFLQQSKNSAVLNRVLGTQSSEILGSLSSNGKVFLINPNGILFGNSANVNVAELVASTLELKDEDFKANRYVFAQDKDLAIASIINQGLIKVQDDGTLALVGGKVVNNGVLEARNGSVYLLAGNSITISDLENPLISYKVAADNEAINLGAIVSKKVNLLGNKVAHGASSQVSYADIFTAANTTKRNDLNAVVTATGEVELFAGSVAEQVQTNKQTAIQVTGDRSGVAVVNAEISTYNPTGKAGNIKVLGDYVAIENNAKLNATGLEGGYINLGGDYQGQGTIKTAKVTYLEAGAEVNTSAQHQAGTIIVWGDKARFAGSLKAESVEANGGFIETSAHSFSLDDKIDISTLSQKGKEFSGEWLLDPANLWVYNATATSSDMPENLKTAGIDSNGDSSDSNLYKFESTTTDSSIKDSTISEKLRTTDVYLVAKGDLKVTSGSFITYQQSSGDSSTPHSLSLATLEATDGSSNIEIKDATIDVKKFLVNSSGSVNINNSTIKASDSEGSGILNAPIVLTANDDIKIINGSSLTTPGEIFVQSNSGGVNVVSGSGDAGDEATPTKKTVINAGVIDVSAKQDVNFNSIKLHNSTGDVPGDTDFYLKRIELKAAGDVVVNGTDIRVKVETETDSDKHGIHLGKLVTKEENGAQVADNDNSTKNVRVSNANLTIHNATTVESKGVINATSVSSTVFDKVNITSTNLNLHSKGDVNVLGDAKSDTGGNFVSAMESLNISGGNVKVETGVISLGKDGFPSEESETVTPDLLQACFSATGSSNSKVELLTLVDGRGINSTIDVYSSGDISVKQSLLATGYVNVTANRDISIVGISSDVEGLVVTDPEAESINAVKIGIDRETGSRPSGLDLYGVNIVSTGGGIKLADVDITGLNDPTIINADGELSTSGNVNIFDDINKEEALSEIYMKYEEEDKPKFGTKSYACDAVEALDGHCHNITIQGGSIKFEGKTKINSTLSTHISTTKGDLVASGVDIVAGIYTNISATGKAVLDKKSNIDAFFGVDTVAGTGVTFDDTTVYSHQGSFETNVTGEGTTTIESTTINVSNGTVTAVSELGQITFANSTFETEEDRGQDDVSITVKAGTGATLENVTAKGQYISISTSKDNGDINVTNQNLGGFSDLIINAEHGGANFNNVSLPKDENNLDRLKITTEKDQTYSETTFASYPRNYPTMTSKKGSITLSNQSSLGAYVSAETGFYINTGAEYFESDDPSNPGLTVNGSIVIDNGTYNGSDSEVALNARDGVKVTNGGKLLGDQITVTTTNGPFEVSEGGQVKSGGSLKVNAAVGEGSEQPAIKLDNATVETKGAIDFTSNNDIEFVDSTITRTGADTQEKSRISAPNNLNITNTTLKTVGDLSLEAKNIKIKDKSSVGSTNGLFTVAATGADGTIMLENTELQAGSFGNFTALGGITISPQVTLSGTLETTIFNFNCKGREPLCLIGSTALGPVTAYPSFVDAAEKNVKEANIPVNTKISVAPITPVEPSTDNNPTRTRRSAPNLAPEDDIMPFTRPQISDNVATIQEGQNSSSLLMFGGSDDDNVTRDVTLTPRNLRVESVGSEVKVASCVVDDQLDLEFLRVDNDGNERPLRENNCNNVERRPQPTATNN